MRVSQSPVRRLIVALAQSLVPESVWRDMCPGASATTVQCRLGDCGTRSGMVVRRLNDGPQRRLTPAQAASPVFRDDRVVAESVRRRCGEPAEENA
ncbi:MAG: hypothetical protein OXQ29_27585 [Rhodospirillaceae bacterium]|nr:hypothetical protein [Rhodospirillaceae bacterium]